MVQRDYAARGGRRKKTTGLNKKLLIAVAVMVVLAFAAGLYFIKNSSQPVVEQNLQVETKPQPKSQLPSRPEEVWSYIKELESRTVPTDAVQTEKVIQLSEKQKEELKKLAEQERQAELERTKKSEQETIADKTVDEQTSSAVVSAVNDEAALKAEQQALEKRKKEEERKKAETVKVAETKKADTAKSGGGSYGLQCGAFKNRAQAESLQARLAMTGLNARVNTSADWNRVVIGPVGDRAAAAAAQKQASSITNCVIIGM